MDITGVSEGVAVIEVSYDAIRIGGSGTTMGGQYGATNPCRTSLVVVDVSGNSGSLVMKAKGSENLWDTELDTVYTLEDTASLSFSAELDGAVPTVELSTDKGATWTSVAKNGEYFTAEGLVPGSNILRFTCGGKTNYQVVRAARVTYTATNTSRAGDTIYAGDSVSVVFNGLYQPAPKFSGIYNPGFGGKPPHAITYTVPENASVTAEGGQYDFISSNKYTITFGKAGTYSFTDGNIHFNIMGVNDPVGGHRILSDAGVGANFTAVSTSHIRSILPELTFTVQEKSGEECEHEWGDCIVTKAHTAAKAGEKRYTCRLCGEYKFEATKKGACKNFAEEVTEQAPTCTEAGHTAGTRCSECWKVLSGMEEIPAKGHSFAEDWTTDETDHWHAATCEHTSEVSGKAAHSGGTAICTAKAVCEVCRASYGDFAEHVFDQKNTDEKYLKSAATCTAPAVYYKSCVCGAASETETFDFGNATGHSFSEEWTTDNDYHWHAATCGHDDEVSGKAAHDWDNGSVSGSIRTYTCKTCEKTKQETLRNYKTVLQETLTQLAKDVPAPAFGTGGGEWTVLALARGEYYPIDSTYFDGYYGRLANSVQETAASVGLDGALHKNKSTENSRVIIALSAIGKDARDVGGVDLVDTYSKNGFNWIQKQGINGPIFALIALDTVGYETADTTLRQQCIDFILGKQLDDGGWALSGNSADPDITSMAIQALAAYQSDSKVKDALDDAVACLSAMQKDDGSFASWGAANAESIAQVIVALSALNIDADTDSRFVKNGHSALDALLQYYVEDKDGFAHVLTSGGGYTGGEVNAMATDQAAYALVAYDRMKIGKTRLYDMSDVKTEPEAQEYDALLERLKNLNVRNAKQRTYQDVQDAQKAYGSYLAGEEYPDLTKKQKDNLADAMDQILEDYEDCLQNAKIDWKSELLKRYQKIDQSKLSSADQKELNRLYQQALESLDNAKYEEQMENIVDQAEREMNNLGNSIRVSFRLIGCEQAAQDVNLSVSSYLPAYVTWIPTTTYTMKTGSTVYDVFMQAIRDNGLSQKGADRNYVESVQAPAVLGGYWLGEFDNGKNSGWMYTVNGKHPGLGLKEQTIQNGDVIIWHYVNDYSHEVADWFNDPTHPALGDGTYYNGWLHASDITPEQYRKNGNGKSGNGSFRDVRISDWFYDDVNYVVEKGLFNGTSTTLFSPNVTMSRAMLVTVLYRLEGEPNVRGGSGFTDVPAGSWYANAVTWAADHGIVNGTSSTTFTPNADITREQMSAILYRYAAYKGYSIRSAASLSSYPDGAAVSSYARDAMAWAVGNGLIQGSGGKLMPGSGATRAQVAAILHRFCDRYVK